MIEEYENRFRTKICSLDLGNRQTLAPAIEELITIVGHLENLNCITAAECEQLTNALHSLRDPQHFKACPLEMQASELVCKGSSVFKRAFEAAEYLFKPIEQEAQSLLLKCLKKEIARSPRELVAIVAQKHKKVKLLSVKSRLGVIISKISDENHPFKENFISNFIFLMDAIGNFRLNITRPAFQRAWQTVLTALAPNQPERFCALLENYIELRPRDFILEMVMVAETNYLKRMTVEHLCKFDPKACAQEIANMNERALKAINPFFQKIYEKHLLNQHMWIAYNIDVIKKPYSQAADPSRNQGGGTCFQNSLDRHSFLLIDACPDAAKIAMGSTQSGRVSQASLFFSFNDAKIGLIPLKEANEIGRASCRERV